MALRRDAWFVKARRSANALDEPESVNSDYSATDSMLESAVASTYSRKAMLIRSLVVTWRHPLLGVGPGNFMVAENEMAKDEGKRKGAWVGTHNSFTQVSSECGIPAFLFYCGIVVLSFQKTIALYRRAKQNPRFKEIGAHALALNYALITFVVTGLLVHAAYTALLPVLAGLTVSLLRTTGPLVAGQADYGGAFTCAVARDNIFATQFHPEKSAAAGLAIFENFIRWNP